jgi:hypothetical protein
VSTSSANEVADRDYHHNAGLLTMFIVQVAVIIVLKLVDTSANLFRYKHITDRITQHKKY